jgi:hypothetical protein
MRLWPTPMVYAVSSISMRLRIAAAGAYLASYTIGVSVASP